jgi:copper chaperone CopZ
VARALEELPGVYRVDVDVRTKEARVRYDPARITHEALREAVDRVDLRLRVRHWLHRWIRRGRP